MSEIPDRGDKIPERRDPLQQRAREGGERGHHHTHTRGQRRSMKLQNLLTKLQNRATRYNEIGRIEQDHVPLGCSPKGRTSSK